MKKKILSFLLVLFLGFSVFLTGCKEDVLGDNPATNANVISNGGMTVVKGDYLYYVNGFTDVSNEETFGANDNKFGEVEKSAIYRTKLVNGEIVKNKDGFVEKTERVVPKVVGFDNGGFYIIDDYIYYSTPYMNYNSSGQLQTSRVEFHKININGSKKSDEKIYTTSAAEDVLDWTVYKVNGVVYILTYVGGKIISVNTEINDVVAEISIDSDETYAFSYETSYKPSETRGAELQNYVYFTRKVADTDNADANAKGNVICKFDVTNGTITKLNNIDDYTYKIDSVVGDNLYYTKANSKYSGAALLYRKPVSGNWSSVADVEMSGGVAYSNYYPCAYGDNMVVATDDNGTYIIENGVRTKISATNYSILNIFGSHAYYTSGEETVTLSRFDLTNRHNIENNEIKTENASTASNTHKITNSHFIDFDNQRIYVYAEYTASNSDTNYYLNYIDRNTRKERFVGSFEADDIPAVPEQKEGYGEDEDVEYTPHID